MIICCNVTLPLVVPEQERFGVITKAPFVAMFATGCATVSGANGGNTELTTVAPGSGLVYTLTEDPGVLSGCSVTIKPNERLVAAAPGAAPYAL